VVARSLYDTAPISRLPEILESYAHSARIQDAQGTIIKSYGKRKVTEQIPAGARKALLACEDHYFLPHPRNPWYVNAFLIHAGVSWPNLEGAVKDTLMGRTRGASTIVMQNAK
jgi:membrane peptidoglycan carboxypeptidase